MGTAQRRKNKRKKKKEGKKEKGNPAGPNLTPGTLTPLTTKPKDRYNSLHSYEKMQLSLSCTLTLSFYFF